VTFIDGNDRCEGCSRCCRPIEGLLVTQEELDRLPLLAPHVVDRDQGLLRLDIPDGCPYLGEDGWCTTFETRPFDCSLFPAQVGGVRRAPGSDAVEVTWRFGGWECPERGYFVGRPVSTEQIDGLRTWIGRAYEASTVTAVHDPSPDRLPARVRRRLSPVVRRLRAVRRR
jgi:Fe-S-cluster containining protein